MSPGPRLVIDGGSPARSRPDTYRVLTPGASSMGRAEEAAVVEVLRAWVL